MDTSLLDQPCYHDVGGHVCCLHHLQEQTQLQFTICRHNDPTTLVDSANNNLPLEHDTIDLVYLHKQLDHKDKQVEGVCRQQSQNSSRGRLNPYPTVGDMAVYCCLGEIDLKATHLKFLLNLHDNHIGGAAVLLLLLLALNHDKSGGTCVGLVMNGLQFLVFCF